MVLSSAEREELVRLRRQLRQVQQERDILTVITRRDELERAAPDLVKREFTADGQNQLWVADMIYVPTWAGFIYLAVVLDVWSRRIVGWAIGEQMTARARAHDAEHGVAAQSRACGAGARGPSQPTP